MEKSPLEHNQQLFFLIDIYKKKNELVTNWYSVGSYYKTQQTPRNFGWVVCRLF